MTITLTAREREVFTSLFDFLQLRLSNSCAIWAQDIRDWLASLPAEPSASPPRVPVSSAHPGRVGVESGPGQPMTDICERLKQDANVMIVAAEDAARAGKDLLSRGWRDTADLEREAAAEIRRLRDEVSRANAKSCLDLGGQRQAAREAGHIEGYRAGIEAAAKWHKARTSEGYTAVSHEEAETAIRALADAPTKEDTNG